jgi:hypothetical protein
MREQRCIPKCIPKTRRKARLNAEKASELQRKLKGLRAEGLLRSQTLYPTELRAQVEELLCQFIIRPNARLLCVRLQF